MHSGQIYEAYDSGCTSVWYATSVCFRPRDRPHMLYGKGSGEMLLSYQLSVCSLATICGWMWLPGSSWPSFGP